jgi:hypothetical protein
MANGADEHLYWLEWVRPFTTTSIFYSSNLLFVLLFSPAPADSLNLCTVAIFSKVLL